MRLVAKQGEGESAHLQYLLLEVGDKHVDGYMGFATYIWFDAEGKFIEQRIVE